MGEVGGGVGFDHIRMAATYLKGVGKEIPLLARTLILLSNQIKSKNYMFHCALPLPPDEDNREVGFDHIRMAATHLKRGGQRNTRFDHNSNQRICLSNHTRNHTNCSR